MNPETFAICKSDLFMKSSDGQILFLLHKLSHMKAPAGGSSRVAIIRNGSPLFTGDTGSGESEIRRWILENDWLEALVALPEQLFYNTGIATYVWMLTNRKAPERRGSRRLDNRDPDAHNTSALPYKCRGFVIERIEKRARAELRRKGVARSRDLENAGVSRSQIRELVREGRIDRVARGLYALPEAPRTEHRDLAEVAKRVPEGVFCLLTALRFHGLTTQNPFEAWIAIHRKAWRPRIEHPPLRVVYLSGPAFTEGVEEHEVEGVNVRVFGAAKTVADCFKFRNKIGVDVAVEALRDYYRKWPKELESVWRYARTDRVARVLQPYLESLP